MNRYQKSKKEFLDGYQIKKGGNYEQVFKTLRDNWIFLLMVLPGTIWLILFFYIPVFGNVVAFKDYHMTGEGFVHSIINSKWVGLDNFKFLFSSKDAFVITRNTVLYNLGFIFIGLVVSVGIAIILSELRSKQMVKIYQTSMLFPYFLSWVIISFFTDAFLNIDKGLINHTLEALGMKGINFYADEASGLTFSFPRYLERLWI